MQPYIDFLIEHWQLSTALLILILLFILNELREHLFGIPRVTPKSLVDLMNHHDGVVIDIRSASDYTKGHILGAINIPQADIQQRQALIDEHKNKTLILVCASGQHSATLGAHLRKLGFPKVFCLSSGMRKWSEEGLPTVK